MFLIVRTCTKRNSEMQGLRNELIISNLKINSNLSDTVNVETELTLTSPDNEFAFSGLLSHSSSALSDGADRKTVGHDLTSKFGDATWKPYPEKSKLLPSFLFIKIRGGSCSDSAKRTISVGYVTSQISTPRPRRLQATPTFKTNRSVAEPPESCRKISGKHSDISLRNPFQWMAAASKPPKLPIQTI